MKIGLALDGLLADTQKARDQWVARLGFEFEEDESFWGSLEPYRDIEQAMRLACSHLDVYVFAERPKTYSLVTRVWIRNHTGINLDKDHLVVPAIKRYDCRLLEIDAFVDSDPAAIENLKIETVRPVRTYYVDRARGESLVPTIEEIIEDHRI